MDAPTGHDLNADQIAYWNGPGGQHWTDRQQTQDVLLAPISDILIDRAGPNVGERVIDVGCGCGATTIALAQKVGPTGHVFGIDISAPMLVRARQVAPAGLPVDFVLADATVYPFDPASADLLVSRFGVMFFAEPALSFANMRKALPASGRLTFACWREPRDNPWLMAPLQAAYKHVPKLPQLGPEDPGPFSFAVEQRVHRILGEAGFSASRWSRATCRSMSRSGAVSTRRWKPHSKSDRRAARSRGSHPTCAPPLRSRSAKPSRLSRKAIRFRSPHRSGS